MLGAEKRKAALADLSAKFDEAFGSGTGLADVAKEAALTVITTDPLQADGTVPGRTVSDTALSAVKAPKRLVSW